MLGVPDRFADCVFGTGIGGSRLPPTVLDEQLRFLPNSPSLNGSESGGGTFLARFFASSRRAIAESTWRGTKRKNP